MTGFLLSGDEDERGDTLQRTLIGAAAMAAAAGVALYFGRKRSETAGEPLLSDAPASTLRGSRKPDPALIGRTVTINRNAQELYDFWRKFENLSQFMDNVRAVETLDNSRSRWTIAAPAGTEIEFVSRITEDQPGRVIAWESEEGATIRNAGRVEFIDAAPGRGTMVRATITYDPPAGTVGRAIAKVLQREPNVQARRDLRRFKQLMETGEVTSSASPSGRRSEEPTKQYL
ncbi:SRPBCC family protein [Sphingosinicella sp. BN140058]|uniref:SRPBCC family protein n=1 Tax=Sphingosinicella sp. BN140058 TaxID=1892855 RepID=UPI001FB04F92|nr:SRPBCC family protein [Sphingosinicella sp. BN140058]